MRAVLRGTGASGRTRAAGRTGPRSAPAGGVEVEPETIRAAGGHVHAQFRLRIVDLGEAFDHRPPGALGLARGRAAPARRSSSRSAPGKCPGIGPRSRGMANDPRRIVAPTAVPASWRRRFQEDRPVVERLPVEGDGPRDRLPVPGVAGRSLRPGPRQDQPRAEDRAATTADDGPGPAIRWSMLVSRVRRPDTIVGSAIMTPSIAATAEPLRSHRASCMQIRVFTCILQS